MNHVNNARLVCALTIASAFTLAACGGNKGSTTSPMGNQTRTESQREANALPLTRMARVPSGLHCGATRAVWVNTHTRTYHEAADPYYGRTKNGQFMCPSAAVSAGYHLAGTRHSGMRGSERGMDNGSDNGATNNADENGGRRHHRKKHASTY